MSIFAKIRGAKKAADEHRKSVALKEANVPTIPYKHVPTHAASDALHVGVGAPGAGYKEEIKAQYRRRSELGPVRSGSDLLVAHAVYRRQSSALSLGDASIASVMSVPTMPALPEDTDHLAPTKPINPAKAGNLRYSYSYNGPIRTRPAFHNSASGTSLFKGKSPLSTMTNSINEMPEERAEEELAESSKHSTKSSASSDVGLEIRYSTPGPFTAESSALHTRATSVSSNANSQKSPKTILADSRRFDEQVRAKSPTNLLPSPIREPTASTAAFDAPLEAMEAVSAQPLRQSPPLRHIQPAYSFQSSSQRLSTPVSQSSVLPLSSEASTPKQVESARLPNHASQRPSSSVSTPRKTNFSRPTVVQEPNSPPRLEMRMEDDDDFGGLDFDIPSEFISFGQDPARPETDQQPKTQPQSNFSPIQSKHAQFPQAQNTVQRSQEQIPQVPAGYERKQSSIPPVKSDSTQVPASRQSQLVRNASGIPFPTFSPRETLPEDRPTVRIPHANYYQMRPGTQSPMQMQQQQDYFTSQQPPLEAGSHSKRQQAYQQLSGENLQYARGQSRSYAPPVSATSPKMGPVTYTRVVSSAENYSTQEFGSISPMASPFGSPVLGPVTHAAPDVVRTLTPPTGPLSSRPLLPQKPVPAMTVPTPVRSHEPQIVSPPEPPVREQPKQKERKPRNFLRKAKKDPSAIKAF